VNTVIGDENAFSLPPVRMHVCSILFLSLTAVLLGIGLRGKEHKKQRAQQKNTKQTNTFASLHCCITHFITYCYLIALLHYTVT